MMRKTTLALFLILGGTPEASENRNIELSFGDHITWNAKEGPSAREHATFFVDPDRQRAVMLAGSGYTPYGSPLDDAWALDLETMKWRELSLIGDSFKPGGARRSAIVLGTEDHPSFVYLSGGYAEGQRAIGDLWRAELTEESVHVTSIDQVNAPPARMLHGFAASANGQTLAVFGGVAGTGGLGDTWIGQVENAKVNWRKLTGDEGPGARFGFAFAHDRSTGALLVCGGQVIPETGAGPSMVTVSDLWSLNFESPTPKWKQLAEYQPSSLPGRRNPAFSFDADKGRLLIWGGTGDGRNALPGLYIVDARVPGAPVSVFTEPDTVPTRASGFGLVDPVRGRALLGFGNDSSRAMPDLVEVRLDTESGSPRNLDR